MMRIPLSAPDIADAEIEAAIRVLESGRLSLGPKLDEFEQAVAGYTGAPFAVAVSSGTAGLHLCVRALGLEEGDEVITTPFSFIASANALLYERVTPVFVDVDPDSLNIDPRRIEAAITRRTRAVLVVHVFGRPAQMDEIMVIAKRHHLFVIEDACEAFGAEHQGRKVGAIGDAGVFAFYPNKQITTGEGGVIVTHDPQVEALAKVLRNQGRDPSADWLEHVELGYNYRLPEISCALGLEQLKRLDFILKERETVARRYGEKLAGHPNLILPPLDIPDGRISWFVYVVRLCDVLTQAHRDWIWRELTARGIGCARYFAPIHLQPIYTKLFGYKRGAFPLAEQAAQRTLALPFFNKLTENQISEVCGTLIQLVNNAPDVI
jgi:perosamine synthetase